MGSNSGSTYLLSQPFLWRAANDRMLIVCHCRSCRRAVTYKAVDLIEVMHPNRLVGELWGGCPRCGSQVNWSETQRFPSSDDVGHLVIRRPNGFRHIRQWKNEFYAPAPYGPPWPPPLSFSPSMKRRES